MSTKPCMPQASTPPSKYRKALLRLVVNTYSLQDPICNRTTLTSPLVFAIPVSHSIWANSHMFAVFLLVQPWIFPRFRYEQLGRDGDILHNRRHDQIPRLRRRHSRNDAHQHKEYQWTCSRCEFKCTVYQLRFILTFIAFGGCCVIYSRLAVTGHTNPAAARHFLG